MEQTVTAKSNGADSKKKVTTLDDMMQICIVAVYLVQKLGKPTLSEIRKVALDKLYCKIDGRLLQRALVGASRSGKQLISVLQDRLPDDQGGLNVDVFAMKDPQRWRAPPEFAHIGVLLPQLLNTPELAEIKNWFDQQEKDPGKDAGKAMRGNDVDEYRNYVAFIYTTDCLLGSQIHCPFTDMARGIQPKDKGDKPTMEGIFVVDELTGDRLLTSDCLNGWFTTNAGRYAGMQDARGAYVAFRNIRIDKSIEPIQLVLPVNNSKQGASAPKSYECIPAGQILRMEFTAPTKGLFTSEQFEKLLHIAGNRPRRGLSPARGKRYGRYVVLGFHDLGPLKAVGNLDYLLTDLPPALAKHMPKKTVGVPTPTEVGPEHAKYLAEATERLKNVVLKPGTKMVAAQTPFPAPDEGDGGDSDD